MATHMPRNDAAAPGHVCPGIRIHAIAIVQPPGIGIAPIAAMDAHQTTVTAALPTKSSAAVPRKARQGVPPTVMRRAHPRAADCAKDAHHLASALVVLIVPPPPEALLVAPLGRAVEPLVHAPETVQSPGIRGIRVIDD